MDALIWVGLIALVAFAIFMSYYLKKKRRQELQMMARQLGLQFSEVDTLGLLSKPFQLFTRGDGRGTENVLWGTWQGFDLSECDYWYYEESTDSEGRRTRTYYRFSCAMTTVDAACSALSITRENLFTRLADSMGFKDIEFELEAFNREFQVKGSDRKFAFDFCDARMMQWLLEADDAFAFEVAGNDLMVYSKKRRPTELVPLLGTLKGFKEHVPRVVYELYPGRAVPPSAPSPGLY